MTVLHVILARYWPGSRSLKQLQVPRCKLQVAGTVIRFRFTILRAELQDLSSSLDDDLRSSLEGGGLEVAEGVCFKEEHGEHEMRREYEKQERVLVFL